MDNIGGANDLFSIRLNNNNILQQWSGKTGGFGTMQQTLYLKKDDKLSFTVSAAYATSPQFNSFTLQKL